MKKKCTINDVANIAGVSKSTVSRYLNNKPIKEETAQKIKKAIHESHYESNMFARLSAKRSHIMGIVLPGFNSTVTPRILTAIDKYLRTKKYTPLIIITGNDIEFEVRSIENLAHMNVDGIIVVSSYITQGHRDVLRRIDTPVIFMGQEVKEGISIVDDNFSAGKDIAKLLAKPGVWHVGCLWVDENDIAVGKVRKQGVIKGLEEQGITQIDVYHTDFTYETSYQQSLQIFKQEHYPQAIACATDRIAFGVYKAAKECGIRIPEDVMVTGFGGYDVSEILSPSLTTIRFDVENASYTCADTILKMIDDKPVSQMQVIGYEIIQGESTNR